MEVLKTLSFESCILLFNMEIVKNIIMMLLLLIDWIVNKAFEINQSIIDDSLLITNSNCSQFILILIFFGCFQSRSCLIALASALLISASSADRKWIPCRKNKWYLRFMWSFAQCFNQTWLILQNCFMLQLG